MCFENECVLGIVIDICAKSFLLMGDQGSERVVKCDTTQEFMDVLSLVSENLNEDQITYSKLAVCY